MADLQTRQQSRSCSSSPNSCEFKPVQRRAALLKSREVTSRPPMVSQPVRGASMSDQAVTHRRSTAPAQPICRGCHSRGCRAHHVLGRRRAIPGRRGDHTPSSSGRSSASFDASFTFGRRPAIHPPPSSRSAARADRHRLPYRAADLPPACSAARHRSVRAAGLPVDSSSSPPPGYLMASPKAKNTPSPNGSPI